MGHESYHRTEEVAGSSNRSFGLVFSVVFAIIALLPLFHGGAIRLWSLGVAAAFAVLAFAAPQVLAPLNRLWFKLGLLLHTIVNPIVLGIMFYVVVTPTGLIMRLLGKDLLRLKRDPAAASYWIERTPPGPKPESLGDQF
jgi:Saxitoxin biosynthesis operon protein SxtJ